MAIRRVSDLPNLATVYDDYSLDDCLVEVSYKKPGTSVFQSFNLSASNLVLGGSSGGRVSSPTPMRAAKNDNAANVKLGPNWNYVATDANGNLKQGVEPSITHIHLNGTTSYDIIDMTYPIGAIFMTSSSSNPYPPGYQGNTPDGDAYGAYKNDSDGICMCWKRIRYDMSIWATSDESLLGKRIEGSLPHLPEMKCEDNGEHSHGIAISRTSVESEGRRLVSPINTIKPKEFGSGGDTSNNGSHSHNVSQLRDANGIYRDDTTSTEVRPTSYGVAMWVRVEDVARI